MQDRVSRISKIITVIPKMKIRRKKRRIKSKKMKFVNIIYRIVIQCIIIIMLGSDILIKIHFIKTYNVYYTLYTIYFFI